MRISPHPWPVVLSLALGLALMLTSCSAARPLTYRAAAIHGHIVDAETGQPIQGAAVVATWSMRVIRGIPFIVLVEESERLHLLETVTDATGAYTIPAWGPTLMSPRTWVSEYTPHLSIFKRGYRAKGLNNHKSGRTHAVPESDWDGKVIQLERPHGTPQEQLSSIKRIYSGLSPGIESGLSGDWKKYPRATLEVNAEARRLQALGVDPRLGIEVLKIERLDKRDREFLRRFEK